MSIVPLPHPVLFTWLKLCYLPSPGLGRIPSFLVWLLAMLLVSCEQLVRRLPVLSRSMYGEERKTGNLVHVRQCSLMEPTQLSAAGHRLGQNHPKCPLEVPVGLFHRRVRSGGAPLCTQGSSCPAVFRLLQSMGTSSILFSCTGTVRVFRGWEDQKSLLFLEREGMT